MFQSRQLATIMYTDTVGHTALIGRDEKRAFDVFNRNRAIQKSIIEQHSGWWIK